MNVAKQQYGMDTNHILIIGRTVAHFLSQRKQTSFERCLRERVTEGIGGGATSSRLKAYGE